MRLQREIDAERSRASDPQAAFMAITRMMWQQVSHLCDGLNNLSDYMKQIEHIHIQEPEQQVR